MSYSKGCQHWCGIGGLEHILKSERLKDNAKNSYVLNTYIWRQAHAITQLWHSNLLCILKISPRPKSGTICTGRIERMALKTTRIHIEHSDAPSLGRACDGQNQHKTPRHRNRVKNIGRNCSPAPKVNDKAEWWGRWCNDWTLGAFHSCFACPI